MIKFSMIAVPARAAALAVGVLIVQACSVPRATLSTAQQIESTARGPDPCSEANCNANAECTSPGGVARCQCKADYYGDGITCEVLPALQ